MKASGFVSHKPFNFVLSINKTVVLFYKRFLANLPLNLKELIKKLILITQTKNSSTRLKSNWCRDLKT